ncbi:acyl-CoA desaturase [Chondromyces apiculatus]|uniref:Fatty acid desaturase n=1 Tax=Chondromyces apiculatus DSM 436 TaxID=1192034 RepID=A0A017T1X4_9BACT|nr:acyl-CoA desaturase [Chondromyces apiculatus]EYF03233.1 Fatty acid desaturase [Chondromyces apiculatus DSM 436]
MAIALFLVAHSTLAVFFQTFFLHRYASHRMFTCSPGWERVFFVLTWMTQGASFLIPRAYAVLHRMHHAYSDTPKDPHSPRHASGFLAMMWATKVQYFAILRGEEKPEARFEGGYPEWALLEKVGDSWVSRIAWGAGYTVFYGVFATAWWQFLLLPVHYLMGPIHGAIVNWCGHRYGYRNFDSDDDSRNTLVFDFVTLGELFQNNHHKYGQRANFAVRWFEVDPAYQVMRVMHWMGIIRLGEKPQAAGKGGRWGRWGNLRAAEPQP